MHAPQESLGFLKSQLTIFSSHRDSSGGEWQELKWRKPSHSKEAFPHDLCTIDINHKIPSSIFQHALLKLFTNFIATFRWCCDHLSCPMKVFTASLKCCNIKFVNNLSSACPNIELGITTTATMTFKSYTTTRCYSRNEVEAERKDFLQWTRLTLKMTSTWYRFPLLCWKPVNLLPLCREVRGNPGWGPTPSSMGLPDSRSKPGIIYTPQMKVNNYRRRDECVCVWGGQRMLNCAADRLSWWWVASSLVPRFVPSFSVMQSKRLVTSLMRLA